MEDINEKFFMRVKYSVCRNGEVSNVRRGICAIYKSAVTMMGSSVGLRLSESNLPLG